MESEEDMRMYSEAQSYEDWMNDMATDDSKPARGWVSLLSVRRAVPFYQTAAPKGVGMTSYAGEVDGDEGLTYFEGLLNEGFRHD